jgi:hypothetical protein
VTKCSSNASIGWRQQHLKKPSLMRRFDQAGLVGYMDGLLRAQYR